jgi:hypothetical protein
VPATSSNPKSDIIAGLLKIPVQLRDRSKKSLQANYVKYQAYLQAQKDLAILIQEGKAPENFKHTQEDVINVFVAKSTYHDNYTSFAAIPSILRSWLEGGPDAPTDIEAWGYQKNSVYNFQDLKTFLKQQKEKAAKEEVKRAGRKQGGSGEKKKAAKK